MRLMSTTQQQVTPELRAWIIEQARAGHQPEAVLASMKSSGWEEDVAIAALEETLRGFLDQRAANTQVLPPPVTVPEPTLDRSPALLRTPDRDVRLLMSMRNPRVIVFGALLSDDECDGLVELARARLARSETVDTATGGNEINEARTSEGMFFVRVAKRR